MQESCWKVVVNEMLLLDGLFSTRQRPALYLLLTRAVTVYNEDHIL